MNPANGQFEEVGIAEVSADGLRMETITGGVTRTAWGTILGQCDDMTNSRDIDKQCDCASVDFSSTASLDDGRMGEVITLPTYRSLEQDRPTSFIYQSDRAYPIKLLNFNSGFGSRQSAPGGLSIQLTVGGVKQGRPVGLDTSYFNTRSDNRPAMQFRAPITFDASNLPSGMVPLSAEMDHAFARASFPQIFLTETMVINESHSVFGAGWMLRGLFKLVGGNGNAMLLISPEGNSVNFRFDDVDEVFISPDFEFSVLTANLDGTHTLTEKDGAKRSIYRRKSFHF